jgi:predicted AlkP superfamily phosphohydrolase/phosphomutase
MIGGSRIKVAMIGLDAAELSFIQQHLTSLPTLRRMLDSGTLHHLESTAGVFPGSVWPTFYSGTQPGEHGVYHHLQWDFEAMQLRRVAENWLYVEPFWYALERRGLRVATIDVPMTFPSRLDQGLEVINWGSHDELGAFQAHPRRLAAELRQRFGRHPMGSEIPVRKTPAQLEKIRRNLVAGAERKSALSRWVLAQADWDFFLTVFGETHRGGHLLWPEDGAAGSASGHSLLEVYRAVDRGVGELLQALPEDVTSIILFSLHGMGRNTSQEHFTAKVIDRINSSYRDDGTADRPDDRGSLVGQRSAVRVLREHVPAALQNAIARAVPVTVRDQVVNRQISSGHDWCRTPGIALLADLNAYLRWNLRGRERCGMLRSNGGELERYVDMVRRTLFDLRTPDGQSSIVAEVVLSCHHFPGRRTDYLPDAIVTWTGLPPLSRIRSDAIGELASEPGTGRVGNHRPDGFCVILDRTNGQRKPALPPRHISELGGLVSRFLGSLP